MSKLTDEQQMIIDELSKVNWKAFNTCHAFSKNNLTYTIYRDGKYNILNVFEAKHISDILIEDNGKLIYTINLSDTNYFEILKLTHNKECEIKKEEERITMSKIIKSLVN